MAQETCFGSPIAFVPVVQKEGVALRARLGPSAFRAVTMALARGRHHCKCSVRHLRAGVARRGVAVV